MSKMEAMRLFVKTLDEEQVRHDATVPVIRCAAGCAPL